MSAQLWLEVQEGLLFAIGPVLFWFWVFLVIGAVVSAIGVVISENLPQIDALE